MGWSAVSSLCWHPPPAFWTEHSICLRTRFSRAAPSQRVSMVVILSPTNSALCWTPLLADFVLELPQRLAETFQSRNAGWNFAYPTCIRPVEVSEGFQEAYSCYSLLPLSLISTHSNKLLALLTLSLHSWCASWRNQQVQRLPVFFIWSPLKFAVFWGGGKEEGFADTGKHDHTVDRELKLVWNPYISNTAVYLYTI